MDEGIFEIDEFLTLNECTKYLAYTKKVLSEKGCTRNCRQVFHIDPEVAEFLTKRLLDKLKERPEVLSFHKHKGFNGVHEKITLTHYITGQFKELHRDSRFKNKEKTDVTLMTMVIYLNDNFEGGRTIFYPDFTSELRGKYEWVNTKEYDTRITPDTRTINVNPKKCKAAVFDTDILHIGEAVVGEKWLLSCKLQFFL